MAAYKIKETWLLLNTDWKSKPVSKKYGIMENVGNYQAKLHLTECGNYILDGFGWQGEVFEQSAIITKEEAIELLNY